MKFQKHLQLPVNVFNSATYLNLTAAIKTTLQSTFDRRTAFASLDLKGIEMCTHLSQHLNLESKKVALLCKLAQIVNVVQD